MSFGIAVGDFITVGKLIKDITDCLRSVGGARSEYQELVKELEALKTALNHLDQLDSGTAPSTHVDTIKLVTTSCQQRLEGFLAKVKKYDQSLGSANRNSAWRGTVDKLGWTFCRKEDIEQLQRDLQTYNSIIGIHLAQHGVERLEAIGKKTDAACTKISGQLHYAQDTLEHITKDITSQAVVGKHVQRLVRSLHSFIFGEIKSSVAHFGQVVNKILTSTQQIYAIVLDIRDSRVALDTRWTYFQDPFVVEDALGRKFPVASEFDYDMLDAIVRRRFKEGAGSQDVAVGNYELCKSNLRSATITAKSQLIPGTAITMVVIVKGKRSNTSCPMLWCPSIHTTPCRNRGFICSLCGVWFDRSTKERQNRFNDTDGLAVLIEGLRTKGSTRCLQTTFVSIETPEIQEAYEEDKLLKNVKIADRNPSSLYAKSRCDICPGIFESSFAKGHLIRHRIREHGRAGTGWICKDSSCNKVFARSDATLKHARRLHPSLFEDSFTTIITEGNFL